jgi:hypothetical protein
MSEPLRHVRGDAGVPIMRSFLGLFLFLLVSTSSILAQNQFAVLVVDSASGESIVGANVLVTGTNLGGTKEKNGKVTNT